MPPQTPPSPPVPLQRPDQHAPSQTQPLQPLPVTDGHEAGQEGVRALLQGLTFCHSLFHPSLFLPTVSAPLQRCPPSCPRRHAGVFLPSSRRKRSTHLQYQIHFLPCLFSHETVSDRADPPVL